MEMQINYVLIMVTALFTTMVIAIGMLIIFKYSGKDEIKKLDEIKKFISDLGGIDKMRENIEFADSLAYSMREKIKEAEKLLDNAKNKTNVKLSKTPAEELREIRIKTVQEIAENIQPRKSLNDRPFIENAKPQSKQLNIDQFRNLEEGQKYEYIKNIVAEKYTPEDIPQAVKDLILDDNVKKRLDKFCTTEHNINKDFSPKIENVDVIKNADTGRFDFKFDSSLEDMYKEFPRNDEFQV